MMNRLFPTTFQQAVHHREQALGRGRIAAHMVKADQKGVALCAGT